LHHLEEALLAVILGAMTLLAFVQVVLRYGFNSGLLWALEANFYLFGWLVLIGAAYCVRVKAHIGVDAIVKLLPERAQRWVGLLVVLLVILYTVLMLYGAWVYLDRLFILDVDAEDIPVKRWILSLCLPIGFLLILVRLVEMGWRIATGRAKGYELADEAEDVIRDGIYGQDSDAGTVRQ
jgi:C4-dicarboxylate transporter DctQ subunit